MYQNYSTYYVEKLMQIRQAELNKRTRMGHFWKEILPNRSDNQVQTGNPRSLWHRLFSSRRLTTSWK